MTTTGGEPVASPHRTGDHCTACGRLTSACPGCGRAYDPPRFCAECGRRLTVQVTTMGWVARCRDHAELRSS